MSLDTAGILSALQSHAQTLGVFDRVNGHESANAPGNGLTCDFFWVGAVPFSGGSGLASTTVVVTFMARIYLSTTQLSDDIDPQVLHATDELCRAYSADFELGGEVRNMDLLGQSGAQLGAQAGWLQVDATKYRTVDVTIPLVVNDLWDQAP